MIVTVRMMVMVQVVEREREGKRSLNDAVKLGEKSEVRE
jgi:hypothetical protein